MVRAVAHAVHDALEPAAMLGVVEDQLRQPRALVGGQPVDADAGDPLDQLAGRVERDQVEAARPRQVDHRPVQRELVAPAIDPAGPRDQRCLVDRLGPVVVEHALERGLDHLHAQREALAAGARRQLVDDGELGPVVVRVGVLLADADGASGAEPGPEVLGRHRATGAGIDDRVRQPGCLDAADLTGLGLAARGATGRRRLRVAASARREHTEQREPEQGEDRRSAHETLQAPAGGLL